MVTNKKNILVDIFFIGGMVLAWSANYLCCNWGVGYTNSPYVAGMFIRAFAFIYLLIYIIARGKFKEIFHQNKIALLLFAVGIIGFLIDVFANIGFKHGDVGTGSVLLKTDILMANLCTVIFLKQRLHWTGWIATLFMLGGIILVLDIDYKALEINWYDLFFIASAVAVTANAFLIKHIIYKYHEDNEMIAFYNNFVVVILFTCASFISGDYKVLGEIKLGWEFWLILAAGGLAQTLVYIFYYRNLNAHPVWKVKLYLLLVPIITCIVSLVAFNEKFTWMKIVGIVLVLVGATLIIFRDKLLKLFHIKKLNKGKEVEGDSQIETDIQIEEKETTTNEN